MATTAIDAAKLDAFMGQFVQDLGAALSVATVMIGDQLGLYKAMADGNPLTPRELAGRTGTDERYVREWLASQAASGYVSYEPATERFTLPAEQAMALAQDNSPAFIPGAFQLAAALIKDQPRIAEAFRSGAGVGWHEHDQDLFCGTERFFRPGYIANLVGPHRRHRLRARRQHADPRRGVPALRAGRVRLSRRIDRARSGGRTLGRPR
jgi:hypothetical protein